MIIPGNFGIWNRFITYKSLTSRAYTPPQLRTSSRNGFGLSTPFMATTSLETGSPYECPYSVYCLSTCSDLSCRSDILSIKIHNSKLGALASIRVGIYIDDSYHLKLFGSSISCLQRLIGPQVSMGPGCPGIKEWHKWDILQSDITTLRDRETVSSFQALRTVTLKQCTASKVYIRFWYLYVATQNGNFDRSGLRSWIFRRRQLTYSGIAYDILD